jgi:hypothetical protein
MGPAGVIQPGPFGENRQAMIEALVTPMTVALSGTTTR